MRTKGAKNERRAVSNISALPSVSMSAAVGHPPSSSAVRFGAAHTGLRDQVALQEARPTERVGLNIQHPRQNAEAPNAPLATVCARQGCVVACSFSYLRSRHCGKTGKHNHSTITPTPRIRQAIPAAADVTDTDTRAVSCRAFPKDKGR